MQGFLFIGKDSSDMVRQGFSVGDDAWYIEVFYNVGQHDLGDVYHTLLNSGCPDYKARHACMTLSRKNSGYTFTDFRESHTLMFMSQATEPEQLYDSVQHEMKHGVEHIGEYFDVDPKSEESAYLQGEIARLMFPAVALVVCPRCRHRYK